MDQIPFGTESFALNSENRCLCVLLLDTSGSMAGKAIEQLNAGIVSLKDELMLDPLAQKRVEIAIVTFGPATELQSGVTVENFIPPTLQAGGDTPIGSALLKGVDIVATRKAAYKVAGIKYYRPWIMLITDGSSTDKNSADWTDALGKIQKGHADGTFAFFPIGVESADMEGLAAICPSVTPIKLVGLRFTELFKWLSSSMKAVSQSKLGEKVVLENPVAPSGWASV
jgi:uncharacterized protein YegL